VNVPSINCAADSVNRGVLDIDTLRHLAGSRYPADVPCPLCGPAKCERQKQNKRVLRIWCTEPDFASYSCARCGAKGYAHSGKPSRRIDRAELARRMRQAELHHAEEAGKRRDKAAWLWSQSRPIAGTIAEKYLAGRGITVVPPVLRFLPAWREHPAAMLAAFAVPDEPEPGAYSVAVPPSAVHLTQIGPAGAKLAKKMRGVTESWPIALVPPNDIGGMVVSEGIEDALSLHQATGLGAWAAGAAGRLPKLAPLIASLPYLEFLMVAVDSDSAGRRGALELASELRHLRGASLEVATIELGEVAHEAG
jgi:hypothetical protein